MCLFWRIKCLLDVSNASGYEKMFCAMRIRQQICGICILLLIVSISSAKESKYDYLPTDRVHCLTTSASGESVCHDIACDDNGNVETISDALAVTWDLESRPSGMIADNMSVRYRYNGLGDCLNRNKDDHCVKHIPDYNASLRNSLVNIDAEGSVTSFLYGRGLSHRIDEDGAVYYFHADEQGNVFAMTDESGTVTDQYAYDAYGTVMAKSGETDNEYLYGGGMGVYCEDVDAGLYHMKARYYSALLKRFISRDPIGLAGGRNLYAYAAGNPLMYVDPRGWCAEDGSFGSGLVGGFDWLSFIYGDTESLSDYQIGLDEYVLTKTFTGIEDMSRLTRSSTGLESMKTESLDELKAKALVTAQRIALENGFNPNLITFDDDSKLKERLVAGYVQSGSDMIRLSIVSMLDEETLHSTVLHEIIHKQQNHDGMDLKKVEYVNRGTYPMINAYHEMMVDEIIMRHQDYNSFPANIKEEIQTHTARYKEEYIKAAKTMIMMNFHQTGTLDTHFKIPYVEKETGRKYFEIVPYCAPNLEHTIDPEIQKGLDPIINKIEKFQKQMSSDPFEFLDYLKGMGNQEKHKPGEYYDPGVNDHRG